MTGVLVGVDLGTSETKALVITPEGSEVGFASRPTSWSSRVETTADALLGDLLGAVADALGAARARVGHRVRALGLGIAGFAESGVLLDPSGAPASPVIAWFDQRGGAELAALDPALRAEFPRRTGLPVLPQWTIGKLLWLRGTGARLTPGSRWLNVPEYLAHALGADQVTEPSLASRTGLLDQAGGGRPWPAALRLLDAPDDLLPPLLAAGHSAGRVRAEGVPEGLAGAVVTVVGHDHPVAAFGVGAVGPHDLLNSCGTAEVVLRAVPGELTDDQRQALVDRGIEAGRHVIAGRSVLIGGLRGGLVMRRVLALLGADNPDGRARLDDAWRPDVLSGVTLTGARPDDEAVHVRLGDLAGPAGGTGRAPSSADGHTAGPDALWAAALEHTGEVTGELLDGMAEVVGTPKAAVAVGGWTRMRSVRETKRRLLPGVRFTELAEPGAFGAALCAAWAAAGSPGDLLEFAEPLRANALTRGATVDH